MPKTKKQRKKRVKSNKGGVGTQKMGYGEAGHQHKTLQRKTAAIDLEKELENGTRSERK